MVIVDKIHDTPLRAEKYKMEEQMAHLLDFFADACAV